MTAGLPTSLPAEIVEASLTQSRERIRAYLHADAPGAQAGPASRTQHAVGVSLIDALRLWLSRQPWAAVARLGTQATRTALVPVAERHPLRLVGAAALAGGLVFWLRPWRGLLRPALLAGIGSQLASRLIARVPVEQLLDGALDIFAGSPRSKTAQAPSSQRAP